MVDCHNENHKREVAGITKIMTAYTAIQIVRILDINPNTSMIETSVKAAVSGGSTADLEEGDVLSINDMLHAMLIPNGNDAAYALAEYFGLLLLELGFKGPSDPFEVFINEMNRNAKLLGMTSTTYTVPHGLPDDLNVSTAIDSIKLAVSAMRLPLFSSIVAKTSYECTGLDILNRKKSFKWTTTNELLYKGFCGVIPGITSTAGGCLASLCRNKDLNLLIIVLGCSLPEDRWTETLSLKDHAINVIERKSIENQDAIKEEDIRSYNIFKSLY